MGLLCILPSLGTCNDDDDDEEEEEDCRVAVDVVVSGLGYRLSSSSSFIVTLSNISVIASAHHRIRNLEAKEGSTSPPMIILSSKLLLLNAPWRRENDEVEEDAASLIVAISTLNARSAKYPSRA